ncbi:MAG: hypothetical protein AB7E47_02515 [Desulfovibrionaceae bacterium]
MIPTGIAFPPMALVGQTFDATAIADMDAAVRQAVAPLDLAAAVRPGQSVAIAVGSRGINRIDEAVAALCALCRDLGAAPFVFPAMGSHGGATPEGQTAVLAALGVTEARVGAPIRATMDTVVLGTALPGLETHLDAFAATADHIIPVGRIKSHTKFKAPLESGLFKMMAVGMAKHRGATLMHRMSLAHGFYECIRAAGRLMLDKTPVLFGLGMVENGFGNAHTVAAVRPAAMEAREEELLRLAKVLSPKIPFPDIDLLIVDRIGKDISGTGMDTNVTGRNRDILGDFTTTPRVKRVVVRDLTAKTGGNALGIGFADFTTDRAVAAMDYAKTVTNALTGVSPEKAAIPIHFATDREVVAAALGSLGHWTPDTVKVVRIADTLHLDRLYASAALLAACPKDATPLERAMPMTFGPDGNLPPFPA